jgi:transcriptional regulator with XRE-family HTH domain
MAKLPFSSYEKSQEEDVKAEARQKAFRALRKAWRERSAEYDLKAKDLAEILGRDKAQVSRVLAGRNKTITLETLALFLEALGYDLPIEPRKEENLPRLNHDARPQAVPLEDVQRRAALGRSSAGVFVLTPPKAVNATECGR